MRSVAVAALCVFASCAPEHAAVSYAYYFHESTGTNKFVMVDGAERGFELDREHSDPRSADALLALKWNVLYPNAKGVIRLFGTYDPRAHTFALRHWQLPAPFRAYAGETTLEPGRLESRVVLRASDFERSLDGDPRIYNQPPP